MQKVPILKLTDFEQGDQLQRDGFCDSLFASLKQFGFVVIRDHGIEETLLDDAYRLCTDLFAKPSEEKLRYRSPDGQRGYTPFGTEKAKDSQVPDLKEFWHIGPQRHVRSSLNTTNVWPDNLDGFQETLTSLYDALHGVGESLLQALAVKLDVDTDYFTTRIAEGDTVMRLLHYPPLAADADPQALRAAAHEDINLITILVAAQGAGLELLDKDGKWLPVENGPRDLIVDTGDMMARITNDVLPSTTHRVVNPAGPNVSRYSMPFFLHLSADTPLTCLPSCVGEGVKYPPTTAGEYLIERLREIGVMPPAA